MHGRSLTRRMFPCNADIIGARFVNLPKNAGTANEIPKARYVAQGYDDKMKPFVVHNNPTLRQSSRKLIISCAALLRFRICLLDITQVCLQAKDKLSREIFIQPKQDDMKFSGIEWNKLLRLNRPLYGTCDYAEYWRATLGFHIREKLGTKSLFGGPSLYTKQQYERTVGLLGSYVNDCLFAGDDLFIKCLKKTQDEFES